MDNTDWVLSLSEDGTRACLVYGNRRVEISVEGEDIVLRGDTVMPTMKVSLRARDLIQEELEAKARIAQHFEGAGRPN
jgi:hypothetical protein